MDWLTISKDSGSGNDIISITASTNTELVDRVARIKFINDTYGITANTIVRQYKRLPAYIRVEPQNILTYNSGGYYKLELNTNSDRWQITSIPDWVFVDKLSGGTGVNDIMMNIEENSTTEDRRGVITFVNSDGAEATCEILQERFVNIEITPTEFNFNPNGEVLYLHLTATENWSWVEFADWVGVSDEYVTGGTAGTYTIALTALKNTTGNKLNGRFSIKCGSKVVSFNVHQNSVEPEPIQTIFINPTKINAPQTGGIYHIQIASNGVWEIEAPAWVGLSTTAGTGNAIIDVLLPENEEYTQLMGTVIFKTKDNTASLSITQDAKEYIPVTVEVSPTDLDFDSTGGTYTIHITSNGEWNITAPDWLQLSNTSGEGDMDVTVTAPENVTYDYLLGDIVITTRDNTAEVSVVQDGAEKPAEEEYLTIVNLEDTPQYFTVDLFNPDKTKVDEHILEYSFDKISWVNLNRTEDIITVKKRVFIRNTSYLNWERNFKIDFRCKIRGNIMSLVNGDDYSDSTFYEETYLGELFKNTKVVNTEELILPASDITLSDYRNMFEGCSLLETAPVELPATVVNSSCYSEMFLNCVSLQTVPELAKARYYDYDSWIANPDGHHTFYYQMFKGCTSLRYAPSVIDIEYLPTSSCWNMFEGCSSLIEAPALPSKRVWYRCYFGMFKGCTSLQTAPELPAQRFNYSIWYNSPLQPYGCYAYMYEGCTSLNNIVMMMGENYSLQGREKITESWVKNVAPTGTITLSAGFDLPENNISGIPVGWTVNYVPQSLTVYPETINVSDEGGIVNLGMTASTVWNVTSCPDFVNMEMTGDNDIISLPIEIAENTEQAIREGNIVITCGNVTKTILVHQDAYKPKPKFVSAVYSTLSPSTSNTALFNFTKPEDLGLIRFVGERRIDSDSNFVIGGANYKSYNYDIIKYSSKKFQVGNQASNLTKLTGEPFDITVKAGENNTTIFTDSISGYEQILQPTGSFGLDPAFDFDKSSKYQADAHKQKLSIVQFAKADGTLLIDAHAAVDVDGTVGLYDNISGIMYTTITELTYDE